MEFFLQELIKSVAFFKPEIVLVIMLIISVFVDVIFKKKQLATGYFALFGFILTIIILISDSTVSLGSYTFSGMFAVDPFSQFFKIIILIGVIITTLMTFSSKELLQSKNSIGEYYILLIGMTIGMFLLASSTNLIMMYLAFETMSISSYVLAGYTKEVRRASEASLKYVIYGSLASGIMIYGVSLIYGLTGTLDLTSMNAAIANYTGNTLPLLVAGLMILGGIFYKISAVPFHFWTPDVYEGSPIATTALLSVSSKAAGFAILIRLFAVGLVDINVSAEYVWKTFASVPWEWIIGTVAVLTMTLGNLLAIWQENVKRLLAYSSIAHAGYLLMGVMVMTTAGIEGVMFYFITYLLMNFGAFYVVQLVANEINSEKLTDYSGLAYRNPLLAVSMTIFMVSLAGVPPLAGFLGKWYLFNSVIEANEIAIAVIGVLNSVVSLYYYMRVVKYMFLRKMPDEVQQEKIKITTPSAVLLIAIVAPVVLLVVNYAPLLEWIKNSATILFVK